MTNIEDIVAEYDNIVNLIKTDLVNNIPSPLRVAILYQAKREMGLAAGYLEASEI
jgi:hypothetical protein